MEETKKQPDRRGDRRGGESSCQHRRPVNARDPLSRTEPCEGRLAPRNVIDGTGLLVCESCGGIDRRSRGPRRNRPAVMHPEQLWARLEELENRIRDVAGIAQAGEIVLENHTRALTSLAETIAAHDRFADVDRGRLEARLSELAEKLEVRASPELERGILEELPKLEGTIARLGQRLELFGIELEQLPKLEGMIARLERKIEDVRATALKALDSADMVRSAPVRHAEEPK